jgi:aspartate aminotransferase
VLRQALEQERLLDLQYSPFGGRTLVRRAVADDLTRRHGLQFGYEDIVLTPGAMAAVHLALRSVGSPGDEVLIPTPCWLDYPLYARYLGLTPVLVPLAEPGFRLDLDRLAQTITPRTCAVLLSHPANPTGRCYGPEELVGLARVVQRAQESVGRSITVIADEAHRDFVPSDTYCSIAETFDATLVVYSFGKYHFMQGQRTGYLAISPRHPARREVASDAVRWSRTMGFCTPTALMQAAMPALLHLRHDLTNVTRWRDRMTVELHEMGYRVAPADATLFLYVATPDGWDDFDFIRALARARLLALPAPLFHHRGYFRLSLTGAARMLEGGLAALHRLAAA